MCKRSSRNIVAIAVCFLCVSFFCVYTYAQAVPTPDSHIVASVNNKWKFLQFFSKGGEVWQYEEQQDESVIAINNALPQSVECIMKNKDIVSFPIDWTQDIPPANGPHELIGQVILSEGYEFSHTSLSKIVAYVFYVEDNMQPYELDKPLKIMNYSWAGILSIGQNFDKFYTINGGELSKNFMVWDNNLNEFPCAVYYGEQAIDSTVVGTTKLAISLDLPWFMKVSKMYKPESIAVTVSKGTFIELNHYAGTDFVFNPTFKWLYTVPDLTKLKLYYSVDQGKTWLDDTGTIEDTQNMYHSKSELFAYDANKLTIIARAIVPETEYSIYFEYLGQETNVLNLKMLDGGISYSVGGNRDGTTDGGSDSGGTRLPTVTEPEEILPPTPSTTPTQTIVIPQTPKKKILQELPTKPLVSTSSLIYSDQLLKMILANPNTVLFENNGASIELSSVFLSNLNLQENDFVQAKIETTEHGFEIQLLHNDKEISDFPKAIINVPIALDVPQGYMLVLLNANNEQVSEGTYNAAILMAQATITQNGEYTFGFVPMQATEIIQPAAEPEVQIEKNPQSAVVNIVIAIIAVLGGSAVVAAVLVLKGVIVLGGKP